MCKECAVRVFSFFCFTCISRADSGTLFQLLVAMWGNVVCISLRCACSVYFRVCTLKKKVWRARQYHIMLIADCRRSNLWANVPKRNAVFRFFNHIFCFYSQISYVKINNLSFVYYNLNVPVLIPKLFFQ